jgi:hypothetical protein
MRRNKYEIDRISISWYNSHYWIHFFGTYTVRCIVAKSSKKRRKTTWYINTRKGKQLGYAVHFPVSFVTWPFFDRHKQRGCDTS